MAYLHRVADERLAERLSVFGGVLIEGPKWCGKTTTAMQQAKSVLRLQDPDMRDEYLATAQSKPSFLLRGDNPRLIDEWQDVPQVWDAARVAIDRRAERGLFILTGSNSVDRSKIMHTGNGRISRMQMLPMSLWESDESTGEISLNGLFDPSYEIEGAEAEMTVEDLIFAACRGGWPATLTFPKGDKLALLVAKDYVQTVCAEDMQHIDGTQRNEHLTRAILRSYARNISTLAKKSAILQDILQSGEIDCSEDTFSRYVETLKRLFVIQDVEAWNPAIRSKTAIRSNPKRSFCDPSIAVAALNLTPEMLTMQLKTFGFIFEQMCIRDLRAYTSDIDSHLAYYRDRYGLEADIVLHMSDGRFALVECKLGSREIEEGAAHLLELQQLIRAYNQQNAAIPLQEPDLLMVLTGGKFAYTREDGVRVVPLACLRP